MQSWLPQWQDSWGSNPRRVKGWTMLKERGRNWIGIERRRPVMELGLEQGGTEPNQIQTRQFKPEEVGRQDPQIRMLQAMFLQVL